MIRFPKPLLPLLGLVYLTSAGYLLFVMRHSWDGHGPNAGTSLITATTWPGLLMCLVGAWLVVRPQLAGFDAYQQTAAQSEAALLWPPFRRLAVLCLATYVPLVAVVGVTLERNSAFRRPHPGHVLQAATWPPLCLLVGVAIAWVLPRPVRAVGMVVAPVLMFWLLMMTRGLNSTAWSVLGSDDSGANLVAIETTWTIVLRLLCWVGIALLCVRRVWGVSPQWLGAFILSIVLTLAALTLPQTIRALPKAEDIHCTPDGALCWREWGRSGAATFAVTIQPLLDTTPPDLRPHPVLGDVDATGLPERTLAIGYPAGEDLTAATPDPSQLRRAYVSALVAQGCESSTQYVFEAAAMRAFGLPPEDGAQEWTVSEKAIREFADKDEVELLDALMALPSDELFSALGERRADTKACSATPSQWLQRLEK